MELQQYLTIMKDRWGTAALAAVLVLAAVAAFTLTRTPIYTATNRVFVQTEAGGSVSERSSGANFASQQIITYADLATTPLVLEPVIEQLDLDLTPQELAASISTEIPEDTLIIDVTASSADPTRAAEIANATSDSLRDQVSALEGSSTSAAAVTDSGESSSTVEAARRSHPRPRPRSPPRRTCRATSPSASCSPSSPRSPRP